jgi:manganese transport protein
MTDWTLKKALDRTSEAPSLGEVNRSIPVGDARGWRKFLAFVGPGYLVSVGYMDPGNWATDLAGGSQFGYKLLWVILVSNLIAMLLQSLCAKLGLVTGKDLAQACRDYYSKPVAVVLWFLCEIAIIACDLAEVIGSAVALNLLFGIPLVWGVVITVADVLLILGLMKFGFRKLEAIVIALVATIAGCFLLQVLKASPNWASVGHGLVTPTIPNAEALLIALGILGATVMPHNLYLHSSVVQTRAHDRTPAGLKDAVKWSTLDVVIALGAAFFVNAAILIVAATVFFPNGTVVTELEQAHLLLKPMLDGAAATAFAVALLCSGQSSTITGTLAGQIVMEGFLRIRVKPWIRRLATRLLAAIPALIMISLSGGKNTVNLLIFSQVVLSMQLSFATFPLVMFTSNRDIMGDHVNRPITKFLAYAACVAIAGLNAYFLVGLVPRWLLATMVISAIAFIVWVKWFYRGGSPRPDSAGQAAT